MCFNQSIHYLKSVFVWDGDQVVMELSEGGKVQKRYIRGNDLVYADKGENTEKTYYVTDTHGNVLQLLDETGNVTKTYEYDSFGNEVNPDKKDENPFRYCGEYYDKETEEIYLRARYYQSSVGRFITRDTYTGEDDEPLSLHLYTYCYNNPIMYSDMGGNCPIVDWVKSVWNWITGGDKSNSDKVKVTPKPTKTPAPIKTPIPTSSTLEPNPKVDTPLYNKHINLLKKVKTNGLFKRELKKFSKIYKKNKEKYKIVSRRAKLPSQLIAAIHFRESSCNFKTYLHNGDPLGKRTIHEPKGKYFTKFTPAAVDALSDKDSFRKKYKLKARSKDIVAMLSFAEVYNGLGYYNRDLISPYIYSGTNIYKSGKFTSDGVYDSSVKDKQ